MNTPISRLKKVDIDKLWSDEAKEFTPWLAENLDVLEESLGLKNLSLLEIEKKAGSFVADLVAKDEQGVIIVIENQLTKTDHDHLGKLLTYMVNFEAKKAIWISPEPREEHIKVVEWLNEITPGDTAIYLLKVEAYCIENSPPAPLFTLIAGPTDIGKATGRLRGEIAEGSIRNRQFWQELIEKIRSKGISLHAHLSPTGESWLNQSAGKSGVNYSYRIMKDKVTVELGIDTGEEEETKQLFEEFYNKKEEIEQKFGAPLEWDWKEGRRYRAIRYPVAEKSKLSDKENWSEIQEKMIEAMQKLYNATKSYLST